MANDITSNPWILDTPNPGVMLLSSKVFIEHCEWAGYTETNHVAELQDINGKSVWLATAAQDLEEVRSAKIGAVNGLQVAQLGSGKIRVYMRMS